MTVVELSSKCCQLDWLSILLTKRTQVRLWFSGPDRINECYVTGNNWAEIEGITPQTKIVKMVNLSLVDTGVE